MRQGCFPFVAGDQGLWSWRLSVGGQGVAQDGSTVGG